MNFEGRQYVYVIQDKVSMNCTPLMLCNNDKHAEREFALFLCNCNISPTDFRLYKLGSFVVDGDKQRPHLRDNEDSELICTGAEVEQDVNALIAQNNERIENRKTPKQGASPSALE